MLIRLMMMLLQLELKETYSQDETNDEIEQNTKLTKPIFHKLLSLWFHLQIPRLTATTRRIKTQPNNFTSLSNEHRFNPLFNRFQNWHNLTSWSIIFSIQIKVPAFEGWYFTQKLVSTFPSASNRLPCNNNSFPLAYSERNIILASPFLNKWSSIHIRRRLNNRTIEILNVAKRTARTTRFS